MIRKNPGAQSGSEPEPEPEDDPGTPLPGFGPPAALRTPFPPDPHMSPEGDKRPPEPFGDGPGSSGPEKPSPASTDLTKRTSHVKAASEIVSATLRAATGLVNSRLAVDDDDHTWLMDDEEVREIARPVARIIVRRVPIPEGSDTSASDVADGITAVVGLVSYLIRCMGERAELRRARRRAWQRMPDVDQADDVDQAHDVDQAPAPAAPFVPGPFAGMPYGVPMPTPPTP